MTRDIRFIIFVLIVGHCIGTITHFLHLFDVLRAGFLHSAQIYGVSAVINGYWLSLTVINPLIVLLLIRKTHLGVIAALINITVNVLINSSLELHTIQNFSIQEVISSLGKINTSLQIALFIFTLFSIPLFLRGNGVLLNFYNRVFSTMPLLALFTGLIIHVNGIYHIIFNFSSLWEAWVHLSMTVINSTLIWAVFKRLRVGYLLGIILFGLFGLVQGWLALVHYLGFDSPWNLEVAITLSICCLVIVSFLRNEARYNQRFRFFSADY